MINQLLDEERYRLPVDIATVGRVGVSDGTLEQSTTNTMSAMVSVHSAEMKLLVRIYIEFT